MQQPAPTCERAEIAHTRKVVTLPQRLSVTTVATVNCSMKFLVLTVLVSVASAATFGPNDPPTCEVDAAGRTIVYYSSSHPDHKSFLCTHTKKGCTCTKKHPTHHHGKCRQFDHSTGKRLDINGDCTYSGLTPAYGAWSSFGSCSKTCGGGQQTRTRTCNKGNQCSGPATDVHRCNTKPCCVTPTSCPSCPYGLRLVSRRPSRNGPYCVGCGWQQQIGFRQNYWYCNCQGTSGWMQYTNKNYIGGPAQGYC